MSFNSLIPTPVSRYLLLILALSQLVSNFLLFDQFSTSELSQQHPDIFFLPANFTFLIWIPIIVFSVWYSFLQARSSTFLSKTAQILVPSLAVVYAGFSVWLILASFIGEYFSPLFRPNMLLGTVVVTVIMTIAATQAYMVADKSTETSGWTARVRNISIGMYLSWLITASIANITAFLYAMSYKPLFSGEIWGLILTLSASVLGGIIIARTKSLLLSSVFGGTLCWALAGLLFGSFGKSDLLIWGCCGALIWLISQFIIFKRSQLLSNFEPALKG